MTGMTESGLEPISCGKERLRGARRRYSLSRKRVSPLSACVENAVHTLRIEVEAKSRPAGRPKGEVVLIIDIAEDGESEVSSLQKFEKALLRHDRSTSGSVLGIRRRVDRALRDHRWKGNAPSCAGAVIRLRRKHRREPIFEIGNLCCAAPAVLDLKDDLKMFSGDTGVPAKLAALIDKKARSL